MFNADDPHISPSTNHPLGYRVKAGGNTLVPAMRIWLRDLLDEQQMARTAKEREVLQTFFSQLKGNKTYRHYYCLTSRGYEPITRLDRKDADGVGMKPRFLVKMPFADLQKIGKRFCAQRFTIQLRGGRKVIAPLFGAMSIVEEKEAIELSLSRIFYDLLFDALPEDPRTW